MGKFFKILSVTVSILFIIILLLSYGISTNKFNNLVKNKIQNNITIAKVDFQKINIPGRSIFSEDTSDGQQSHSGLVDCLGLLKTGLSENDKKPYVEKSLVDKERYLDEMEKYNANK